MIVKKKKYKGHISHNWKAMKWIISTIRILLIGFKNKRWRIVIRELLIQFQTFDGLTCRKNYNSGNTSERSR